MAKGTRVVREYLVILGNEDVREAVEPEMDVEEFEIGRRAMEDLPSFP